MGITKKGNKFQKSKVLVRNGIINYLLYARILDMHHIFKGIYSTLNI
jgi:hypothetical protein